MKLIIRLFFKTLRLIIGPVMLFGDWITTPKGITRDPEKQSEIDARTSNLVLYQFKTCPFCIKTRRAIKRLSLNITTCDAQHNETCRQTLLQGGGEIKVPCLRIWDTEKKTTWWLYESDAIISYLNTQFGETSA